jgi:hypothetical protein
MFTYGSDFGAHEISGGNVGVSKLFNQLGTLCSLSGGGATENERNFGFSQDLFDTACRRRRLILLCAHLDLCLFLCLTSNISNN